MSQEMIAAADAIRARFATLESVPGSAHHDNDKNPTRPELMMAPQKNGFCRASENVVAFSGEETVVFVGEDANKSLKALQAWTASIEGIPAQDLTGTQQKMLRAAGKLPIVDVQDVPRLTLRRSLWNDFLEILHGQGQGVSGLPLPDEED